MFILNDQYLSTFTRTNTSFNMISQPAKSEFAEEVWILWYYSRWLWGPLRHWMARMAQTSLRYQNTWNQPTEICRRDTRSSSPTTSTKWKTVDSWCSGKTTTASRTQTHLPGGVVAGHQSQRFLFHQEQSPQQGPGAARQRTPTRPLRLLRLRCHLGVENREEGQEKWLDLLEVWQGLLWHQRQQQQQQEGLGVGLQRRSPRWLKWVFSNRLLMGTITSFQNPPIPLLVLFSLAFVSVNCVYNVM